MLGRLLAPPPRFVLAIGNEGALLLHVAGARVVRQWRVDGHDEAALASLRATLGEAPRRPVVVVSDLLEQSYRRETVPKLGRVDRAKVIKRRLERAFPDTSLKAALKLSDDPEEPRSHRYLFTAVSPAPDWDRWIELLRTIENPVAALTLLPIEATDLVTRLVRALAPAERRPKDWAILISRQQTGGFRQIVVNRGELVLTRLTPSLPADTGPADVAAEIQRELRATLGYMTRLGYRAGGGLEIVVLGDEALKGALVDAGTAAGDLTVVSAAAAAAALGLGPLASADEADGVLLGAAWVGRRRRWILQLLPADLRTRMVQTMALRWASAGLATSALALLSYSALSAASGLQVEQEIDWLSAWQGTTRQQLERSESELDRISAEAEAMRALLAAHAQLQADRRDPFDTLRSLRGAMRQDEELSGFKWHLIEPANPGSRQLPQRGSADFTLDLTLDLGRLTDPAAAVAATEDLAGRLREAFAQHPIAIKRQAVDILPNQAFVGGTGLSDRRDQQAAAMSADLQVGALAP